MCNEIMVSTKDLVKRFNNITALDKLSLEVPSGIFGLIGPNGAGKTTLFRILIGLISPDAGTAYVCGQNIDAHLLEIRQLIGVLHERPVYPKSLSAKHYLQHVANLYGSSSSPDEYLALVGLSESVDRKIGSYSAGMIQRLGLAQALIGKPKLVLLDEPTSNLDVIGREAILNLVVDLHQKYKTSFLIASHILSDLEKVCTSIAFIKKGKVIKQGDILDIVWNQMPNEFIIVLSDPTTLQQHIKNEDGIIDTHIAGSRSLLVELDEGYEVQDLEDIVSLISSRENIKVYSIEKQSSLEGTFRRVIENDY